MEDNRDRFQQELADLINKYSKENGSDTPDFILAMYLVHCLETFDVVTQLRTDWYSPPNPAKKTNGGILTNQGDSKNG